MPRVLILALILSTGVDLMGAGRTSDASLHLSFRHVINGKPLLSDSLRYRNAGGEVYSVTRVSYLLSGFAMETLDGNLIEIPEQSAWIDVGARRTSVHIPGIPRAKYRSMRFFIGPDTSDNERDPASFAPEHPFNPNTNGLHWSWQGGFIFLALEGKFRSETSPLSGFSYHLARSPNRTPITMAGNFDLNHPLSCVVDFDIATLLNAPDRLIFERDGNSTHSRDGDPIARALASNLPGAFQVYRIVSRAPEIVHASEIKPLYLPSVINAFPFRLSRSFPIPKLPRDNPLLQERVDLGRQLFDETALSRDNSISCASCHLRQKALADPRRVSLGVEGRAGTRNAMPLFNLAWKSNFFWDGRAASLREQALMPIEDHSEMDEAIENVIVKLSKQQGYREAFGKAFDSSRITGERIGLAIENFLLTQTSYQSKFDRVRAGEARFSKQERRGFELFMTEYEPRSQRFGADCFHCHGGVLFSDHQFHNNGLETAGDGDLGRFVVTRNEGDRGKFATPSLRNIALTAPYMHDGRFSNLTEVVNHYNRGIQRSPTLDANLAKHPMDGLGLSKDDVAALVAFLETLTDAQFVEN